MEVVVEEEVVEALEEMAGLPAVALSKLPVLQHLVPGVQVHGGVARQTAGKLVQLLAVEPLHNAYIVQFFPLRC